MDFKELVEKQTVKLLKCIRCDKGKELVFGPWIRATHKVNSSKKERNTEWSLILEQEKGIGSTTLALDKLSQREIFFLRIAATM